MIWDVATGAIVATIKKHHGFVKGVAWDPFNKYLATQASGGGEGGGSEYYLALQMREGGWRCS